MSQPTLSALPLVSVITSVKNGEKYLRKSLQSIIDQDYTNFEFIIIDDYSTDKTIEILHDFSKKDNRVKVYKNSYLPGLANALNYGISLSKGKYIVRQDADDVSLSERLRVQVEFMESHLEIFISGSYINLIDEDDNFLKIHREPLSNDEIKLHLMVGTPFAHPSVIMRRDLIIKYNLSYQELPAQDYELWSRAINAGLKGENLPKPLVNYRVYKESDSALRAPRHEAMATLISNYQITQFTSYKDIRFFLNLEEYKRVAHYLLTGNAIVSSQYDFLIARHILKIWKSIGQIELSNPLMRYNLLPKSIYGYIKCPLVFLKYMLHRRTYKKTACDLTTNEKESLKQNIPIIIIVRDRLSCLRQLISRLENDGYKNLILLNNNSSFPPLLEFLSQSEFKVINLHENLGHTVLWQLEELRDFIKANWFVYTDPDVIPTIEAKSDYVATFFESLLKLPKFKKAGFSLKIDDLPDHFHLKKTVTSWEKQFYKNRINENYIADIDTTFALYRPNTPYCFGPAIRSVKLFARHLPWYLDGKNLDEDELFYRNNASQVITTWNVSGESKELKMASPLDKFLSNTYLFLLSNSITHSFAKKTKELLRKNNAK
ncbi:glycosyltransferase [Methylophilus sp. 13]|uniref:glycosyltransferase family 2 protein n=1 Tax=Methylophilus sp. 13 TaxID=2781018 RepID=UPI00188FAF18|nr:glycosyltransferase [Methylophilus sp. 13]MBF5038122.1 glycosyltransferase [Methylophilus sp. 13]